MAKNQKKGKRKVVELTPQEKFEQLLNLKKAVRCMLVEQDVYDIYIKLTKDFADLAKVGEETPFEGWEQCMELSQECAQLAEEWKKTHKTERVIESRTVMTSAKEREKGNKSKKTGKGKWIGLALLIVLAGIVVSFQVDSIHYQIARLEAALGLDDLAELSYKKLGFYKDSEDRRILLQKKKIRETPKGKTVNFGTVTWKNDKGKIKSEACKWIVLDKKEDSVLLTKYNAINDMVYHDVDEEVSWATSWLRKELNSTFLQEIFSEKEREIIQKTTVSTKANEKYQTSGGETTTDSVFIMNEDEVYQYRKQLREKVKDMRLRTPGKDGDTTTYVSVLGHKSDKRKEIDIIEYGYPVDRLGVCIRPTMWVNCKTY